jgi:mannosyl-3-phosphoglycerate phosphatase
VTARIVFTDLDESLLDRDTYSFAAARPALEELRRRAVPLVFCTSKTAAESLHFQKLLGIREPFVIEGGGGVGVPPGYFDRLPSPRADRGEYVLLPLAAGRDEVLAGLGHLKEFTANSIRGFDDMTAEEVARETGLPLDLARLAKEREFDEPFKFVRREGEFSGSLPRVAAERGLRVTRGGRYYHLHGDTDKGRAVRLLEGLFRKKLGPLSTIGIGDSEMDLPLLNAVDVPIAVQGRGGLHDPALVAGVRRLRRVDARGPEGWNRALLEEIGR